MRLYNLPVLNKAVEEEGSEFLKYAQIVVEGELSQKNEESWEAFKYLASKHLHDDCFQRLLVSYVTSQSVAYGTVRGLLLAKALPRLILKSTAEHYYSKIIAAEIIGENIALKQTISNSVKEAIEEPMNMTETALLLSFINVVVDYPLESLYAAMSVVDENDIEDDILKFVFLINRLEAQDAIKKGVYYTEEFNADLKETAIVGEKVFGRNPELDISYKVILGNIASTEKDFTKSYKTYRDIIQDTHGGFKSVPSLIRKLETVDRLNYFNHLLYFAKSGLQYSRITRSDSTINHASDIHTLVFKQYLDRLEFLSVPVRNSSFFNSDAGDYLIITDYLLGKNNDTKRFTESLMLIDRLQTKSLYESLFYEELLSRPNIAEYVNYLDDITSREVEEEDPHLLLQQVIAQSDTFDRMVAESKEEVESYIAANQPAATEDYQQIATSLSDNEAIVYVSSFDNILHQTLIKNDTLLVSQVADVAGAYALFEDIQEGIQNKRPSQAAQDSLTRNLRLAYQYLFADLADELPDTLHIVANGYLSEFPFAALRRDTSGQVPRYFGMDHTLSRQFGIKVFDLLRKQPSRARYKRPLAFSPDFGNDYAVATAFREVDVELQPLTFNQREVASIAGLGDGTFFMGEAATESSYRENAGDYGIIHLATHATANLSNGRDSRLFLLNEDDEPVSITAEEVGRQSLNADLVTLSACETGSGGRHLLEGTVGLTKSYLMAGSRSVVSSLWSVDDKFTADIMSDFYAELRAGASIPAALQTAQRNHLERFAGTEYAHPRYWAAFTAYGSPETPAWEDEAFPWLWVCGGVVLLLFGFVGYRRMGGG